MKLNPRFFDIQTPEEVAVLRKSLSDIEGMLDIQGYKFPEGLGLEVWPRKEFTDVYPVSAQVENYVVDPSGRMMTVSVLSSSQRRYVQVTLGGEEGENLRLRKLNFFYAPRNDKG